MQLHFEVKSFTGKPVFKILMAQVHEEKPTPVSIRGSDPRDDVAVRWRPG